LISPEALTFMCSQRLPRAEQAIGGVATGLIAAGEEVEWKARHWGIWFKMRVRITAFQSPRYFQDCMVNGPFRSFTHDHTFESEGARTLMTDRITFFSPVPLVGGLVDRILLCNHLREFIEGRNAEIKTVAESNAWQRYLPGE
jgi:ligand-binding SRPBCC domain-containing protein